jgi:hypothetical protein
MKYVRKIRRLLFSTIALVFAALMIFILVNSALDIYNNFAYEKAIMRDSPYGGTPLLVNPADYTSADGFIKSGDFVYVEDWVSAANGRVVFAKVKSKLKEGYINKELLVQTNINLKPIISVMMLLCIMALATKKLYSKLSEHNIVLIKN